MKKKVKKVVMSVTMTGKEERVKGSESEKTNNDTNKGQCLNPFFTLGDNNLVNCDRQRRLLHLNFIQ